MLQPPNLRDLNEWNNGVFPIGRIVTRIDGRFPLVSHGSLITFYGEFFEGDDTPIKAATGQTVLASRSVAFFQGLQEGAEI